MINNKQSRIVPLALMLGVTTMLMTACEPVPHYNRLQVAPFTKLSSKPYGSVKVFRNPQEVTKPYEVVGMLSCEGSAGEEAGIVNAMLYRAADMGGDGIILGGPRSGSNEAGNNQSVSNKQEDWAAPVGDGDRRAYWAQVIKFKD